MSAQKRRVERVVRGFRAMALLACNMPRDLRASLDAELRAIPEMRTSALRELEARTEAVVQKLRDELGALKPMSEYLAIAEDMERHPDEMLWTQKHVIDTQLFSRMGTVSQRWKLHPPHTRFGIDTHGHMPDTLEWRLLEASLFESAALLWNDTLTAEVNDAGALKEDKIAGKRYRELKRSTIRALFALIEGYLNGIAYDIILTSDVSALSKGAREALLERSDDGRAKFKTLREKLFGYPRLALERKHSPVEEADDHVAYVLAHEHELRDAFVHPTPRRKPERPVLRERTYYEFELREVSDLFDHTIGLIRYLDGILDGRFGRVETWLADRDADGRFPPKTFF